MKISITVRSLMAFVLIMIASAIALAQTTEFTYQGRLKDGANPANGNYDFEFQIYSVPVGGINVNPPVTVNNVAVVAGIFTVTLDFGPVFTGNPKYLDIRVRNTGGPSFTTLSPRQHIVSSPYAVRSVVAGDTFQLGGIDANQYVQTNDARLSDARPPTAGSASYIQNQTAVLQPATSFRIQGDGTVSGTIQGQFVNATNEFRLAGDRVLRVNVCSRNTHVGLGAGAINTGCAAGGNRNSFFGTNAGLVNTGSPADQNNSFFGADSGDANAFGFNNSFFGADSGGANTSGDNNSFFGFNSGVTNTGGNRNTMLGAFADLGSNGLSNATAIGAQSFVTASNALILGSINGENGATADARVGIGTTAPLKHLHVRGAGDQEIMIESSDTGGLRWSLQATAGAGNGRFEIIDRTLGVNRFTILNDGKTGIGTNAPLDRLHVNGIVRITSLGPAGPTPLCINGNNQVSTCLTARPASGLDQQAEVIEHQRSEIQRLTLELSTLRQALCAKDSSYSFCSK